MSGIDMYYEEKGDGIKSNEIVCVCVFVLWLCV